MRLLHVTGLDKVPEYPIRLQRQFSSRADDDAGCSVPVRPFYLVEKLHENESEPRGGAEAHFEGMMEPPLGA